MARRAAHPHRQRGAHSYTPAMRRRGTPGLSSADVQTVRALASVAVGSEPTSLLRLRGGLGNTMAVAAFEDHPKVVVRLARERPEWLSVEAAVMARAAATVPVPEGLLGDADRALR